MAELTGKTISELPESTSMLDDDIFPFMRGSSGSTAGTSRKASWDNIRKPLYRLDYGIFVESGTNIDELLEPGTYAVTTLANVTGGTPPPTEFMYKLFVVRANNSSANPRLWQIAQAMGNSTREYRRNYNNGAWGAWRTVITDADFDPFKEKLGNGSVGITTHTIAASTTGDIPFADGERAFVVFSGAGSTVRGACIVFCSASSHAVNFTQITEASSLSLTGGTNKLTVENTNTSGASATALVLRF